jgi:hypothetical protein
MHDHFDPDTYREEVTRRLHANLQDRFEPQWTGTAEQLAGLLEAIGAWDAFQCEWEDFGKGHEWKKFLVFAISGHADPAIRQLRKTVLGARRVAESHIVRQREGNGALLDEYSVESARIVLKDRMRIELMAHGWEVALRQLAAEGRQTLLSLSDGESCSWRNAYDDCLEEICTYDMVVRRGQAILANTPLSELRAMRSLLFGKRVLPWWLDGRVEVMSLARTCPGAWRMCETSIRECGFTDRLVAEIMRYVDGAGNRVAHGIDSWFRGDASYSYKWEIEKDDGEVYLVELLAPKHASGKRIQLRLRTQDGMAPTESSWLMGRMMMLNGLMFHWTRTRWDGMVSAELPNKGNPLPKKGRFVLVDLFTTRVLKPLDTGVSGGE